MSHRLPAWLAVLAAAVLAAPGASAQGRPERPFRGLFGSGAGPADHSLVANGSIGGGWDNNVVLDLFGSRNRISNLNTASRGGVGHASGSLSYGLNLTAVSVNASGGTSVHFYPTLASRFVRRYFGSAGASVQVSRYITAQGSVAYTPFSLSSLLPYYRGELEDVALPDVDFASSIEHYRAYSAGAAYQRQLSRRTRINADYSFRTRDGSFAARDYHSHRVGGGLTHELGRDLNFNAGYRYGTSDRALDDRSLQTHNINVGIDYNRSLSFSRRTTLSFSTGTAAVTRPLEDDTRTRFSVIGDVQLTHEIGRTWNATAGYARNVRFDEDWPDFVSSDSLSASLAGLLSQRLQFQSSVRGSTGKVGLSSQEGGFRGYYANAGLAYALGRQVGVSLTYAYYRHRFARGVELPADFANHYNRHSVRASLNLWAPLFARARRP